MLKQRELDNRCTLLIMGRDASLNHCYITSFFLDKFWCDCPYEIVLCTQTRSLENSTYDRIIYTDSEMIWGDRLEIALHNIHTKYVILLAEDFFLKSNVKNDEIQRCIIFCEEMGAGAVRLTPPVPFSVHYNKSFDVLPEKSIYRICLQPTLFNVDYLRRFSGLHLSPWQFEREGSLMSRSFSEPLFCTKNVVYDSIHAWSHGMWDRQAYELMIQNGLPERLFQGAKIYPWYLTLRDKVYIKIISIAPDLITKIRIQMCKNNEKKLKG